MSDIRIPLADLRIGHYVKLPLSWKQHPFLFSSFRIKDESQLAIIHTLGLDEIVVDPSKVRLRSISPLPPPLQLRPSNSTTSQSVPTRRNNNNCGAPFARQKKPSPIRSRRCVSRSPN